jgi:hypothetical protein
MTALTTMSCDDSCCISLITAAAAWTNDLSFSLLFLLLRAPRPPRLALRCLLSLPESELLTMAVDSCPHSLVRTSCLCPLAALAYDFFVGVLATDEREGEGGEERG